MSSAIRDLALLLDRTTRLKLILAVLGAFIVAGTEMVALATLVPLMQLLTGTRPTLGWLTAPGGPLDITAREMSLVLSVVIFASFLFKGVFSVAYRWWSGGFIARAQTATSVRLLDYYLRAPYPLHLRRSLGEFTNKMNDAVGQVYGGVIMGSISVFTEGVTIAAVALTLLITTPVPAMIMTAYFAVTGVGLYLMIRQRAQDAGRRALRASQEVFSNTVQPLQNIRDVKIRDNAEIFVRRYEAARHEGAEAGRMSSFLIDLPKYTLELLFVVGVALVMVGVYWWLPEGGALTTLGLLALAGFRVLPSMTRLMASMNSIRASTPGLEIVMEELRLAESVAQDREQAQEPLRLDESLTVRNLSFGYRAGAPVLHDINLTLKKGRSLALVGGSGAGKTTLADCLIGLLPPTQGVVLVDGVDIQTRLRGWQSTLGTVPQSVLALDASALDNITFRDPKPDRAWASECAARAQLLPYIEALPDGLDSALGPGEYGMSGGQRQRLGLARALYRRPTFLVLDEATSALDNATEREITDAIDALAGQVTLVVIAHRLSTVRHCDEIAYMKDGRIEDLGTFDELNARNPEFAYLVALGNLESPLSDDELARIRSGEAPDQPTSASDVAEDGPR